MESETIPNPSSAAPGEPVPSSSFFAARERIVRLYLKHEKYSGVAFFFIGFLWDSLTLTRVDNPLDNSILLLYLIILGAMITLILQKQNGAITPRWIQKVEPHFPWVMQFIFGGLFSSYVVFYFKSASWSRTQFFFLILVCLLVANEFLKDRLQNPVLLALLYSFCLLSFFAFFLPVLFAAINERIFLLAGFLSLAICFLVFSVGVRVPNEGWKHRMKPIAAGIAGMILLVNALYFANLIPPVPLALKDAGIYHRVSKTASGYEVQYVPPPLWRFWRKSDSPFFWSPGERVYCFTAVFAPGKVRRIPVRHIWSQRTPTGWKVVDNLGFDITVGGREGGYRGYTSKQGIWPGRWRVEVVTIRGQTLGHITFDVVTSPDPHPPIVTRIIR